MASYDPLTPDAVCWGVVVAMLIAGGFMGIVYLLIYSYYGFFP